MDQAKILRVMDAVKTLTADEQRFLNSLICANIRSSSKQAAVMSSIAFKVGDVVKFDGKTRGPIFIKIYGFSRDRTKIKGAQLNRGWKTMPGVMWTVASNIVKASSVEEAETNRF
jgi:hypothetical protein